MRGAWIEIQQHIEEQLIDRSPPVRGAWIEIQRSTTAFPIMGSPPVRGAWIEILIYAAIAVFCSVASREGGVD